MSAGNWTLGVAPMLGSGGVRIRFGIDTADRYLCLGVRLTREEAREHALAILAATGDGTMRSFRPDVLLKSATAAPPIESTPIEAPSSLAPWRRTLAIAQGFTGDSCDRCGGTRMLRSGTCLTCQDCGATTGCS